MDPHGPPWTRVRSATTSPPPGPPPPPRDILQAKVDDRQARLERLWLRQSPAGPLEAAVRAELAKAGLTLGGCAGRTGTTPPKSYGWSGGSDPPTPSLISSVADVLCQTFILHFSF